MIKVENLCNRFGHITTANNISCNFEERKVTVILGGSGSGKSTMLKQIVGLDRPDSGRIIFDGKDVTTLSKKDLYELRKKMGMLFQGSALFNSLNIFENVAFPLREHTKLSEGVIKTIIKIKLEMVGLRGVEEMLPSQLSGGMTKRVGLARAIVLDPKVVFYDEPTSGLDPKAAAEFMDLLAQLRAEGKAILMSTHDIFRAKEAADRVGIMQAGRLLVTRTRAELAADDLEELYLRYMDAAGGELEAA